MDQDNRNRRRLRWWPVLGILALAAGALAWIWLAPADSRQVRVMQSLMAFFATFILLVLWLLLASGLRWWQRLVSFACVLGLVAFLAVSLEVRQVSGDVVPRFAFKWTPRPDERLATDIAPSRAATGTASRDSFPQFLGPQRNATITGVALATDWQASPPRRLWRRAVGAGNSGVVIANGLAITQEQRGEEEMTVAYDLLSGEPRWAHGTATRHQNPLSGDGPCATPAVADGKVYALGATGFLSALELTTGERIWSRNVLTDAEASKPQYGLCTSPLIDGDQVVVVSGGNGALRAYALADGTPRWADGRYRAAYASPTRVELAGTPQIVVFHNGGESGDVTGHGLDGTPLWSVTWPRVERTSQPLLLPGDRLFLSSGYGAGAKVFQLASDGDRWTAELVWQAKSLKAKLTQVVYRDGYIFGLDDGILVAIDAETGARSWKRGRYGHGQVLLVGDVILVLSEKGAVALVAADPQAYRELGRIDAIDGRTWNTPALAGRYLVVRNTQEATCFELPTASG